MALKRWWVMTGLLALACCYHLDKSVNEVCCLLEKQVALQTRAVIFCETVCHRLQSTPDWQPTSHRKPEIFHHFSPQIYLTSAQKLLDQKFPRGTEGAVPSARTLHNCDRNRSINPPPPYNGSAEVRLWNTEHHSRNWGQSSWEKKEKKTRHHPTILPIP